MPGPDVYATARPGARSRLASAAARRRVDLPVRYTGFEIPDEFVVGYGLDYAERYRNLPYVAVLTLLSGQDPAGG